MRGVNETRACQLAPVLDLTLPHGRLEVRLLDVNVPHDRLEVRLLDLNLPHDRLELRVLDRDLPHDRPEVRVFDPNVPHYRLEVRVLTRICRSIGSAYSVTVRRRPLGVYRRPSARPPCSRAGSAWR